MTTAFSASDTPPPSRVFIGFFLASAAALASVFVFQYGFGLMPCVLCVWQRAPHAIAILIAGIGIGQARTIDPLLHPFRPVPWQTFTILAALLCIDHLINAGLAGFHIGVEQHWWAGTDACTGGAPTGLTTEQLRAQLLDTKPARCDEVAWSFLGISLAGFNFLLSLALAGAAAWAFVRFNAERVRRVRKVA
jgi:disulfide bond formation protein DsbB